MKRICITVKKIGKKYNYEFLVSKIFKKKINNGKNIKINVNELNCIINFF